MWLAMRRAKHFLPSRALPPYPDPTLQINFSCGKCRMYRRIGSRSPRECSPATKSAEAPNLSWATFPMRDMMRMFATTYGLSVTSTPILLSGESTGPRMYGMTYMVRPRIALLSSAPTLCLAPSGSIQLLVGPASSFSGVQIKVKCSVRATSLGLLRLR